MANFDIVYALQDWITQFLVEPLIIMLLGIFAGKLFEQLLLFFIDEFQIRHYSTTFIAYIAKWIVYIIATCYALSTIGILSAVLWFLLWVVLIVLAMSFILSTRDFFVNVLFHHTVKTKYKHGAAMAVRFCKGTVVRVHLSDTHIRTAAGDDVFIPNSTLAKL